MPDNRERFDSVDTSEVRADGEVDEASLMCRAVSLVGRVTRGAKDIGSIVAHGDPGEMIQASAKHLG